MKIATAIFLIFGGACISGQALRVMYQFVFFPGSSYTPALFDIFFDWMSMLVVGLFLIIYATMITYRKLGEIIPVLCPKCQTIFDVKKYNNYGIHCPGCGVAGIMGEA
jgi:hypothetical protein